MLTLRCSLCERCETLQKRWVRGERGGRVGRRATAAQEEKYEIFLHAQGLLPLLKNRLKAVCQHSSGVQRSLNHICFYHSQCDLWGKVFTASPASSMCSENGSSFKSQQSTGTVAILAKAQTKR